MMSYHATLTTKIPNLPSAMSTQQVEQYMEELRLELRKVTELWLAKRFTDPPTSTTRAIVILKDFS